MFSRHDRVRASSRLISRRATASRAVYAASRADGKTIPASSPLSAQRNIELGRVCLVNLAADPLYGKLVTIVDFVDMNRVRIAAKHRAKRAAGRCPRPRAENPRPPFRGFPSHWKNRGVRLEPPPDARPDPSRTAADPSSFFPSSQVLVDAPDIQRCVISLRRLAITSLVVDLEEKSPSKEALAAALKSADVEGKWAASAWGKKIAKQQARKSLTDFDRYKVMVARVKRSALIKKALA